MWKGIVNTVLKGYIVIGIVIGLFAAFNAKSLLLFVICIAAVFVSGSVVGLILEVAYDIESIKNSVKKNNDDLLEKLSGTKTVYGQTIKTGSGIDSTNTINQHQARTVANSNVWTCRFCGKDSSKLSDHCEHCGERR